MSSLAGELDIRLSRCKAILRLTNMHKLQLASCVMSKKIHADSTARKLRFFAFLCSFYSQFW